MSITIIDNGYFNLIIALLFLLSELCFYMHTNTISKNFASNPNKQELHIKLFLPPIIIHFIIIQILTFYIVFVCRNSVSSIFIIIYYMISTFMKGKYIRKTMDKLIE